MDLHDEDGPEAELEECREEVRQLEEENYQLRQSAQTFGDLAERLNISLAGERRQGADRRAEARSEPDRRQTQA